MKDLKLLQIIGKGEFGGEQPPVPDAAPHGGDALGSGCWGWRGGDTRLVPVPPMPVPPAPQT